MGAQRQVARGIFVHKRLERGTFTFPARVAEGVASVVIDVHELAVLLERIEVDELKTKPRWEPERVNEFETVVGGILCSVRAGKLEFGELAAR